MSPIINLNNVKMSYSGTNVLNGLNLEVSEGSVYAFLGRNGTGKTTTIKILLGLLEQESGTVSILNKDPAPARDRS